MQQRFTLISALMLALALSAAGCSNEPTPEETGCATDADCKDGKKCNTAAKQCVECTADAQCGAGKICKNNTCQPNPVECSQDVDCAAKDLKYCSTANKCEWACTQDFHCGLGQQCINHACEPRCSSNAGCPANKPFCDTSTKRCMECGSRADCAEGKICQNGACTADICSTCTASQICFNGEKCLDQQKTCAEDTDCGTNEACLDAGAGQKCFPKCNPDNNVSATDMHNPECMNGYGICLQYSQEGDGACLPPLDNTQDLNETCWDIGKPGTDGYNDCKTGLFCMFDDAGIGSCWKACDPTKNTGGEDVPGPNPACASGVYCVPDGYGGGGCDPRTNTRLTGETCDGPDASQPDFNHCVAGNYCLGFTDDVSLCTKACNPTATTNTCGTGYECWGLSFFDPTLGGCIKERKPTRNTGETCEADDPRTDGWNSCVDALTPCINGTCGPKRTTTQTLGQGCELTDSTKPEYNACATGLSCYQSKCATACTKTDASACGATEFCFITTEAGAGICQPRCDTANGVIVTTECPTGMYCASNTTTYKPGYCKALPAFKQGPAQKGESCSNYTESKFCDGSKNLYCVYPTCMQACDPRQGIETNAACATGESCFETAASPLGGTCKAAATQTVGQACSATQVCKNGLFCDTAAKVCTKVCNPANNTATGNSSCDANYTCQSSTSALAGGYCKLVPQPTRQSGETCLATDPSKPEYNDCVTGLACDKTKTPPVCVTPVARFAKCGTNLGVCASAQVCVGGGTGSTYCLDKCNPSATPSGCGAGFECLGYSSSDPTAGACVQTCTAVTECTSYGTTCTDLGETTKYCL